MQTGMVRCHNLLRHPMEHLFRFALTRPAEKLPESPPRLELVQNSEFSGRTGTSNRQARSDKGRGQGLCASQAY